MHEFVSKTCSLCYFHVRKIANIRNYLSEESAAQLVHAMITSRIDYCNSLLAGVPDYDIKRLQRLQNIAARIMTRSPRWTSASELLKRLHWLPVKQRIAFKTLLLTYKALHGLAPLYISNLLSRYDPVRTLRSSESYMLDVPRTFNNFGDSAFSYNAAVLWNSLPDFIRLSSNVSLFKCRLKTFLFTSAFT